MGTSPKRAYPKYKCIGEENALFAVNCLSFSFFLTLEHPRDTATLITVIFFFHVSSTEAPLLSFGIRPSLPKVLHCINLQREPQLKLLTSSHGREGYTLDA